MQCKRYSHFFSKKFQHICVSLDVNFNESLTNDIVSFELLGPENILMVGKDTHEGLCFHFAKGDSFYIQKVHSIVSETLAFGSETFKRTRISVIKFNNHMLLVDDQMVQIIHWLCWFCAGLIFS